jgi:CHAD domain-containing protein
MNREQVKQISDSRYRKLIKYGKKIAEHFDVEDIHQFRVEYKKLRAFFRMLSYSDDEIKIAKELKESYTIAGTIRDMQLQQVRMLEATANEPKKPLAYLTLLQNEIGKLQPDLIELFAGNAIQKSKKKTDVLLPALFPVSHFQNFIHRKWEAITAILASGYFSDDNIHAIRKMLKDLFYNLKEYTGSEYDVLGASIRKGREDKYFDTLLEELGNFQDQCIAIALLKSWWLNDMKTYNKQLLEKVKKQWIKNKISTKQALVKKMKADLLSNKIKNNTSAIKPAAGY